MIIIDPDDNLYNDLNVDSVYYTEDDVNDKIVSIVQAASTFSIISQGCYVKKKTFARLLWRVVTKYIFGKLRPL